MIGVWVLLLHFFRSDIACEEIARQLCRMQQRVYCAISPRHLLALNWKSSDDDVDGHHNQQTTGVNLSSSTVTRAV